MPSTPLPERRPSSSCTSPEAASPVHHESPFHAPASSTPIENEHDLTLLERVDLDDRRADLQLKKLIGFWVLGCVVTQLALVNIFMGWVLYTRDSVDTTFTTLFLGFTAGTFAEVVAIMAIIARYLFPQGGRQDGA